MFKRLSLTISMLLLTATVGFLVWAISNNYQHTQINNIFLEKLKEKFEDEVTDQRIRFDRHVKAFSPAVRIYASLEITHEYITLAKARI